MVGVNTGDAGLEIGVVMRGLRLSIDMVRELVKELCLILGEGVRSMCGGTGSA